MRSLAVKNVPGVFLKAPGTFYRLPDSRPARTLEEAEKRCAFDPRKSFVPKHRKYEPDKEVQCHSKPYAGYAHFQGECKNVCQG